MKLNKIILLCVAACFESWAVNITTLSGEVIPTLELPEQNTSDDLAGALGIVPGKFFPNFGLMPVLKKELSFEDFPLLPETDLNKVNIYNIHVIITLDGVKIIGSFNNPAHESALKQFIENNDVYAHTFLDLQHGQLFTKEIQYIVGEAAYLWSIEDFGVDRSRVWTEVKSVFVAGPNVNKVCEQLSSCGMETSYSQDDASKVILGLGKYNVLHTITISKQANSAVLLLPSA